LSFGQVQFVLAHEALHCGLSHFARREHREINRWNIACDHAVNLLLSEDRLEPVPEALCDEDYKGLAAEEIYPLIRSDSKEEPLDKHLYDNATDNNANNPDIEQSATDRSIGNGNDQTNAENAARDVVDIRPPPLSPQEREQLKTQWQQRLVSAAQQASQSGKMSGSVARLIDRLIRSTVPWRTLLARFMSGSSKTDYNLMRPSQRREGDAILPSLFARQTNAVIAVDTSGSIEEHELTEFIGEINAIKSLVNARITLLACDSFIDSDAPWVTEPWEQLIFPKTLQGGGGTDFKPVFEWVESHHLQPDLIIYFTDAKGRFPSKPPVAETLWLVKGSAGVPWGQRIQLN